MPEDYNYEDDIITEDEYEEEEEQEEIEEEQEEVEEEQEEEYEEEVVDEDEYSDEEDVDEITEDTEIEFRFDDGSGNEVVERYTYSDLRDIVAKKRQISDDKVIATANEVIQAINNNDLLKSILYYQKQGYTDDQIIEGLYKVYKEKAEKEDTPQFDSIEEEVEYKISKRINDIIKPLEEKIKKKEFEEYKQQVYNHNNALIYEALKEYGYENLDPNYVSTKLREVLIDLYPELNPAISPDALARWATFKFNKSLARNIVKIAFSDVKVKGNKKKVVDMSSKNPPKIMPSVGGRGKVNQVVKKYATIDERAKAYDKLINS